MTIAIITSDPERFDRAVKSMCLPWQWLRPGDCAQIAALRFVRVEHEDGCRGMTFDGFIQLDVIDEQTAEQIMRATRRKI